MKNGTSKFEYSIFQDCVKIDVTVEWDDYGFGVISAEIDSLDISDELYEDLAADILEYAEGRQDAFISGDEDHAEFIGECERNGD